MAVRRRGEAERLAPKATAPMPKKDEAIVEPPAQKNENSAQKTSPTSPNPTSTSPQKSLAPLNFPQSEVSKPATKENPQANAKQIAATPRPRPPSPPRPTKGPIKNVEEFVPDDSIDRSFFDDPNKQRNTHLVASNKIPTTATDSSDDEKFGGSHLVSGFVEDLDSDVENFSVSPPPPILRSAAPFAAASAPTELKIPSFSGNSVTQTKSNSSGLTSPASLGSPLGGPRSPPGDPGSPPTAPRTPTSPGSPSAGLGSPTHITADDLDECFGIRKSFPVPAKATKNFSASSDDENFGPNPLVAGIGSRVEENFDDFDATKNSKAENSPKKSKKKKTENISGSKKKTTKKSGSKSKVNKDLEEFFGPSETQIKDSDAYEAL